MVAVNSPTAATPLGEGSTASRPVVASTRHYVISTLAPTNRCYRVEWCICVHAAQLVGQQKGGTERRERLGKVKTRIHDRSFFWRRPNIPSPPAYFIFDIHIRTHTHSHKIISKYTVCPFFWYTPFGSPLFVCRFHSPL